MKVVGREKFRGFGFGGSGHAGQLVVHPEVILQSDRRESLILFLDLHSLFRLYRLVETF